MSAAEFFVLGATHRTAPLELREKLSLDAADAAALRAEFAELRELREHATLATCNRIEFYGVASSPSAVERMQSAFCARRGVDPAEFEKCRLRLAGRDALIHLIEVAAGLDSQMLGETEIFGQVKDAYAGAQASGSAGPILNRIFQKTFQTAKHVRTHTAITSGQISVSNVAVDLAATIFGSLASARILILGAGEIGQKTARAFRSRGAGGLSVAGRNAERVAQAARELEAEAIAFAEAAAHLAEFDVVVCSTSAPYAVVDASAAAAAMRKRPARPLFFIDLAMPRDVDPAVGDLVNVFLYNLEDLAKIAEENRAAREAEIAECRRLIGGRADALWSHIEPRLAPVSPTGAEPFGPGRRPVLPP